MGAVFAALLKYVVPAITAIPELVHALESLWAGTKKAGPNKWIAVETALSQSITLVAQEIAQLAPDTPVDKVSAKVAVFTKAVNDAFVTLCNELGIFQKS